MPLEQTAHGMLGQRKGPKRSKRLPALDERRASTGDDGNPLIGQPADSDAWSGQAPDRPCSRIAVTAWPVC